MWSMQNPATSNELSPNLQICIINFNFTEMTQFRSYIEREQKLTPFIRHKRILRTIAQTRGSQFPLVPMVNVNGLKSQTITEPMHKFSGTPRFFKIVRIKYPTSKSRQNQDKVIQIATENYNSTNQMKRWGTWCWE